MHRRKTKLAHRMNRVLTHRADRFSKALERRGIRTTYELHDRILSNRTSRRVWAGDHVELDDVQQRIVGEVDEQGYSLLTFGELFADPQHWQKLEAMRDRFVAETEAELAAGGENVRVRAGKEFVIRLHAKGAMQLDRTLKRSMSSAMDFESATTPSFAAE